MELLLPGGAGLLATLVDASGIAPGSSPDAVADPTPEQLQAALDALAMGHAEFVIVEDGEAFVQVAGDGDGPYQLELRPAASGPQLLANGPIDRATVARALHGYLRRDPTWPDGLTWSEI